MAIPGIDFKNSYIYQQPAQQAMISSTPVGESSRAGAGSVSPTLSNVDMKNIVEIASRRGGAVEGSQKAPEVSIPGAITAIEPQQEIVRFGTREALGYITQPKSKSANAYNKLLAANAYPGAAELTNAKKNKGLDFIS